MSLNVGDQEYNGGKKYRQKGTLCGPNKRMFRYMPKLSSGYVLGSQEGRK
jgi:hypothetical protein